MKNNDPALLCFEFESVYTRGLCQSFNIIASADIEQLYSFNALSLIMDWVNLLLILFLIIDEYLVKQEFIEKQTIHEQ